MWWIDATFVVILILLIVGFFILMFYSMEVIDDIGLFPVAVVVFIYLAGSAYLVFYLAEFVKEG
ncbi:MAG: hypothetical protein ACTSQ8_08050 [Candidatus Helarchaeota archaeon]